MARRLILDTGLLVTAQRRSVDWSSVVDADDDVVIAAITVAELEAGVELARDRHRSARRRFVDDVVATIPVEPYSVDIGVAHGRLLAAVQRAGRPRGAHDLIIAATAVTTRRTVLSTDLSAGFDLLPGVDSVYIR